MQTTTAFIARSFSEKDDSKISPIVRFLENFSSLGLVAESAEKAEAELVSKKVRDKIDAADIFVCILTRRHPIVSFEDRFRTAWQVLLGHNVGRGFTAPPWLLQELGYALRGGKRLLILRESDVEVPMLPGDYEYIDFAEGQYEAAFGKAASMITNILAERAGIIVQTTATLAVGPAAEEPSTAPNAQAIVESKPSFGQHYFALKGAITQKDWGTAESAYRIGLQFVQENDADNVMFWTCLYQELLADAGRAEAMDALRSLRDENPDSPDPLTTLARCHASFGDHSVARDYYLRAAELETGESMIDVHISAAREMKQGGQVAEAREALSALIPRTQGMGQSIRLKVLQELYAIVKEQGEKLTSYAIGELCLSENPAQSDFRFTLGLGYYNSDYPELFLHHFSQIHEHNSEHSGALHNLALAASENELLIASVEHYQKAIKMGETLSASNLAHKYLDAGFATEAKSLLDEADAMSDPVPDLTSARASINKKRDAEAKKLIAILEKAEEHRQFLTRFGEGLLSDTQPSLDGKWRFPFGEMMLTRTGKRVSGSYVEKSTGPRLGMLSLYGTPGGSTKLAERTTEYTFEGTLEGRSCQFKITIEVSGDKGVFDYLAGTERARTGFLTFSTGDAFASVLETDNGKPKKFYRVERSDTITRLS